MQTLIVCLLKTPFFHCSFILKSQQDRNVLVTRPADVAVSAVGSVPTETSVVPGTIPDLALRVNVKEGALFVVTGIEPGNRLKL